MKNITIENPSGDIVGSFHYDPSRPNTYVARGKLARDTFDREAISALIRISIQPNGTAASPAYAQILEKAEHTVYCWFDTFLGYDGAGCSIFRTVRPFAAVGGKFFCQTVMKQVAETVTQKPADSILDQIICFNRRKR